MNASTDSNTTGSGAGASSASRAAARLAAALKEHLARRRIIFDKDVASGQVDVWMPNALERKYPNACREWGWQFFFVASNVSTDPVSGVIRKHHQDEKMIQRHVARKTGDRPRFPRSKEFTRLRFSQLARPP